MTSLIQERKVGTKCINNQCYEVLYLQETGDHGLKEQRTDLPGEWNNDERRTWSRCQQWVVFMVLCKHVPKLILIDF